MKPGLTARIGNRFEMTGRRFRRQPGAYITTLEGVDGGGEVSYDTITRTFGVGVYDTANRRDRPRLITIRGFLFEDSHWKLRKQCDRVAGLLAEDDDSDLFLWEKYGETRTARVRRHQISEPTVRPSEDAFADFTIVLRAPDQRIYGLRTATGWGSVVTLVNRGSYPAPVTVEVRGASAGGWTIAGPRGAIVAVGAPITTGANHRYDGDTGLLEIAGVPQISGVLRSDRIEIPPGSHTLAVNNGCEMNASFASTWAP